MQKNFGMRAAALSALMTAGLLAGCVTTQTGYSQLDNEGKREYLAYAAAESPVYLKVVNSPLPGGDPAASVAAASHATGSIFGSTAAFTADPAEAKHADYYVVMAVNLPVSVPTTAVCEDKPLPPPVPAGADGFRLTAGFCTGGQALSTSTARGPAPAGVDDEAFRALVRGAMQELFPIERERDPDEQGNGLRIGMFKF
ncbi:hypothetical protein [Nisaea sediminum]|uniref:hypothetical protein n=1 Tax=Nisaea sediminum TaxID=2775867 RepID=UPI00186836B2|nr:hypothetical protein [Nisaea sediminum]